ncbi:DUF4184 family protein [Microbacterium luticocti]|uniref:DUF4184 family protein n=1 Tax=Microbacterium luticocti TaxID=451764 RepID=UPI0003F71C06|nr:DUF4184 family protein [Microbacterium luticocti]
MPFTPSHAIVALPFVRTPLVPAAIAVGAMAPDLPLFVRFLPFSYQTTHTNVILTAFIALALLALWYLMLRPAVRELSPRWLATRLPREWDLTGMDALRSVRPGSRHRVWRDRAVFVPLLVVAVCIGVLSHIAWDAFTHEGRWGTVLFPALAQQWGPFAGYKWAQYGSSMLGLAGIAVFFGVWVARRRPEASLVRRLPNVIRWCWWMSLPALLLGAWLIGMGAYGPFTADWTMQHLAYRVLPPACAVWGALTLVLCVVVLVRRPRRR